MEKIFQIDGKSCTISVTFDNENPLNEQATDKSYGRDVRNSISTDGYYISGFIDGVKVTGRGNLNSSYLMNELIMTASDLCLKVLGLPPQDATTNDIRQILIHNGFA